MDFRADCGDTGGIMKIIITIICLILSSNAYGVEFSVTNKTPDKTVICLYWLDHGIKEYQSRWLNIYCGEIPVQGDRELSTDYPGHIFGVTANCISPRCRSEEVTPIDRAFITAEDTKCVKIVYDSTYQGEETPERFFFDIVEER
jgi:hypothetical protein